MASLSNTPSQNPPPESPDKASDSPPEPPSAAAPASTPAIECKPLASKQYSNSNQHHGFKKTCTVCGTAAYITHASLVKALMEGLRVQRFEIVSVAKKGQIEGTVEGMLIPLMQLLRKKGFVVR